MLTDRHVEASDGYTHRRERAARRHVELPQAQHTERNVDIAVVRQRRASAIQTVPETAEVPQSRHLDRVVDVAAATDHR